MMTRRITELLYQSTTRRNYTNLLKNKQDPGFVPVTEQFNKKLNFVLFNAQRCLVELFLTKSDNVIAKIELEFSKELKKQYPDSTEIKKLEIMEKHQG